MRTAALSSFQGSRCASMRYRADIRWLVFQSLWRTGCSRSHDPKTYSLALWFVKTAFCPFYIYFFWGLAEWRGNSNNRAVRSGRTCSAGQSAHPADKARGWYGKRIAGDAFLILRFKVAIAIGEHSHWEKFNDYPYGKLTCVFLPVVFDDKRTLIFLNALLYFRVEFYSVMTLRIVFRFQIT